jgi:hypothetical protein
MMVILAERKAAAPEKSHQGQWKRKKGPAPALPIPPKRQVSLFCFLTQCYIL